MFRRSQKLSKATNDAAELNPDTDASKRSISPFYRLKSRLHGSQRDNQGVTGQESCSPVSQGDAVLQKEVDALPKTLAVSSEENPQTVADNLIKTSVQNLLEVHRPVPTRDGATHIQGALLQERSIDQELGIVQPLSSLTVLTRPISCLWDEAYLHLNNKDSDLMKDYSSCILKGSSKSALALTAHASATSLLGMSKSELHKQMVQFIQLTTDGNEAKVWKANFLGHELAVKDMVRPVIGIVEWAKDYVGSAVESSAVGSAAWAGICLLLPLMLNPGQQGEERLNALSHVTGLLSQCKMREELYKRRYERETNDNDPTHLSLEHETYKDSLRDLYVKILSFLATCSVYLSHNTAMRTARSMIAWDGWADLNAEILAQEKALLAIEARFDAFRVQEEWEMQQDWNKRKLAEEHALVEEITRITRMMQDEKDIQLFTWLSSVNIDAKYNTERKRHQKGTGTWLVEGPVFENWKTTANSVLWLHGKAGAGKSNLSTTAIGALQDNFRNDQQIIVAYFYFDFRDVQKQNAEDMVRSLLSQICQRRPTLPPAVTQLWDQYRNNPQAQEPGLKDKLLPALKGAIVDFKGIYIVLDGLDECSSDNDNIRTILTTLDTICSWSATQLHIMFTSRFLLEIKDKFSSLTSTKSKFEINMDLATAVNTDIRTFILAELSEHGRWSPAAKETVTKALIERADGMFQYVTLQLQGLRRAKSDSQRANVLRNLPQGLNETYKRALSSIPADERPHTIRALKWLMAALRPLVVPELAEACRIDLKSDPILEDGTELDTAMSVWDLLPPGLVVLETNSEGDSAYFSHSSFPDYLRSTELKDSESDAKEFFISQHAALAYVAECCMAYHVYASCDKEGHHDPLSQFPLWGYAAEYWMPHMEGIPAKSWSPTHRGLAELILQSGSELFLDMTRMTRDSAITGSKLFREGSVTPLYCVASHNHIQLLKMLLHRQDNEINVVTGWLGTALNMACYSGFRNIVHELLQHGADPYLGNKDKPCALSVAMLSSIDIVDQIVRWDDQGDLVARCAMVGFYPLHKAVYIRSSEMVAYFLEHGIPIDVHDSNSQTPLQFAAYTGNMSITALLLREGASLSAQGMAGTALHNAARNGGVKMIKLLLHHGADTNSFGGAYGYALAGAAYHGKTHSLKLLLHSGARINAEGGRYGNALQSALAGKKLRRIVKFLLESGARVQPPGLYFEKVLERLRQAPGGEKRAQGLQKFHQDFYYFNTSDTAQSMMQNPENGCWSLSSPAQGLDYYEKWRLQWGHCLNRAADKSMNSMEE